MRSRLFAAALSGLLCLVSACLEPIDLSGVGYRCAADGECASGHVCRAQRCAEVDAGIGVSGTVYRLHHAERGAELLTTDFSEARRLEAEGYVFDRPLFLAAESEREGYAPVYRLDQPMTGDHLYTRNASERDSAVDRYGYVERGIAFWAATADAEGRLPIHRLQRSAYHRYAVGDAERAEAVAEGWNLESLLFYGDPL